MRSLFVLVLLLNSFVQAQEFEGRKKLNGADLYLSVKGEGTPLVILHGGPGLNHHYFKPHLSGLEQNFKVIYYDHRSNGQSSTPAPDSISFRFFADDLEAIRKEFGIDKLNILAHSWGATVATHYASAYPDRVNKLIYSNPAVFSREYDKEVSEAVKKRLSREDSTLRVKLLAGTRDIATYDQLMRLSFRTSAFDRNNIAKLNLKIPDNVVTANRALFTGLMKDPSFQANLYDSLKSLRFPVLIIHGEADILPQAAVERLKNNLPNAEVIIFKQSGHFPFVEETEKYTTIITQFLNKKN